LRKRFEDWMKCRESIANRTRHPDTDFHSSTDFHSNQVPTATKCQRAIRLCLAGSIVHSPCAGTVSSAERQGWAIDRHAYPDTSRAPALDMNS